MARWRRGSGIGDGAGERSDGEGDPSAPLRTDGGEPASGDDPPADGGSDFVGGFVWTCPECGREHQKNSPPCSRCGNIHLEKRRPDYSDVEDPDAVSWFEALELKYLAGYVVAVAVVVLILLSVTGVLALPMFGGQAALPEAPGQADAYANVSFDAVEDAYVNELNGWRDERGVDPLSVGSGIDRVATAYNRERVRAAHGDGSGPDPEELLERYEYDCPSTPAIGRQMARVEPLFEGDPITASTVAHRLQYAPDRGRSDLLEAQYSKIGYDLHVSPDGTAYALVIVC